MSGDFLQISHYYTAEQFRDEDGVVEILVRFKGSSDGHVILAEYANTSETDPVYIVSFSLKPEIEIRNLE